jgi:hypothetical protein
MEAKANIVFTYMEFLFIAEVNKQILDEVAIYDVHFALAANPQAIEAIEIYRGSGPYNRVCWRQRFVSAYTSMVDPELVDTIGDAIKVLEDI